MHRKGGSKPYTGEEGKLAVEREEKKTHNQRASEGVADWRHGKNRNEQETTVTVHQH
jgi:hypothetical protein